MNIGKYYQWQEDSLIVELHIQPKSSKNAILGEYDGRLKIAITQAPQDGKANHYLIKFLAKYFAVPKSHITIIRGEKSKHKTVAVFKPRQNAPIG